MMQIRPEITIKLKLRLGQIDKEGNMKWRINYIPIDFFQLILDDIHPNPASGS